jgi:hypothetical protein
VGVYFKLKPNSFATFELIVRARVEYFLHYLGTKQLGGQFEVNDPRRKLLKDMQSVWK